MPALSTLRGKWLSTALIVRNSLSKGITGSFVKRQMGGHGGHVMEIKTSEFAFKKCIDMFHWYTCLSIALYGSIILYCNVFIGDAELREIPEGYVPKYWEYEEHPISRFLAWWKGNPQMFYENFLHQLSHQYWDLQLDNLDKKIKFEMKKHKDYKAYYYRAISANTLRLYRSESTAHQEQEGWNPASALFPTDFKDENDWPEERPST